MSPRPSASMTQIEAKPRLLLLARVSRFHWRTRIFLRALLPDPHGNSPEVQWRSRSWPPLGYLDSPASLVLRYRQAFCGGHLVQLCLIAHSIQRDRSASLLVQILQPHVPERGESWKNFQEASTLRIALPERRCRALLPSLAAEGRFRVGGHNALVVAHL